MDPSTLQSQATAAVLSLTEQLAALQAQQRALLDSISHTSTSLSSLPSYNAVAPTFSAIPTYAQKLARLKKTMVQQQQDVEALKRRAQEAGKKRRENLRRMHERRREEGERDRTVLRARMVGESHLKEVVEESEGGSGGSTTPIQEEAGERSTPVTVVKKRKKARKVEIL
jgi:hypothetical protein